MDAKWKATHVCGNTVGEPICPMLHVHRGENGERDAATGKAMQKYAIYCRREGKLRKIGELHSWTGLTPKWCPLRQKLEGEL